MSRSILIDAGPLIALFSKRDQYHDRAVTYVRDLEEIIWTTWPVITEASHMLDFNVQAQINLLTWIVRGGLHLVTLDQEDVSRIESLTDRYRDVPMDLADASLIVAAEKKGIRRIASIDGDFYIYRTIRNQYLENDFLKLHHQ